jgi:hypothetical protein
MLRVLLLVSALALIAFASERRATSAASYGDLALTSSPSSFATALQYLSWLNKSSMPTGVKPARKALLSSRSFFDVFAYAYPKTEASGSNDEIFDKIRADLDEGYEFVGVFQDLQYVSYSEKDFEKRLGDVLDWKDKFENHVDKYNYVKFSKAARTDKLYDRKKSDLSNEFWGAVEEVPSLKDSGLENVAELVNGQYRESKNYYDDIIDLEKVWKTEYHDAFHEFRKLLRSIEFCSISFPAIYGSYNTTVSMLLLHSAYDQLGAINDVVNEYVYYKDAGKNNKAEEAQDEVKKLWNALQDWLKDEDFRDVLNDLKDRLKRPSPLSEN